MAWGLHAPPYAHRRAHVQEADMPLLSTVEWSLLIFGLVGLFFPFAYTYWLYVKRDKPGADA